MVSGKKCASKPKTLSWVGTSTEIFTRTTQIGQPLHLHLLLCCQYTFGQGYHPIRLQDSEKYWLETFLPVLVYLILL